MQAPGQAVVGQSLLQNVLDGGVDVHGLIGGWGSDRLCLLGLSSLSIGNDFFLSACGLQYRQSLDLRARPILFVSHMIHTTYERTQKWLSTHCMLGEIEDGWSCGMA